MVAEEEEAVDWPELPSDMVELIMNKLMTPEISDYIRCGAICISWRTVFINHHCHRPPRPRPVTLPPLLIVPTPSSSSNKKKRRVRNNTKSLSFYNIIHKKVYNGFKVTIPSNRHFRGSSHGWLVAVDQDNDCQIRLVNPFLSPSVPNSSSSGIINANKGEILLPSLKDISIVISKTIDDSEDDQYDCVHRSPSYAYSRKAVNPFLSPSVPNSSSSGIINANKDEILLPSPKDISIVISKTIDDSEDDQYDCVHRSPSSYAYLRKAVLSADPLSNPIDYIVMAILGSPGRLAYCRPGGGGCHDKAWNHVEIEYPQEWGCRDVIYYKGKFIALYYPGIVVVLDPTRNMIPVILKIPRPRSRLLLPDTIYLVESAGSLLQVYREIEVGDEDIVTKRDPYSTTRFRVFKLWDKTKKMNFDIAKVNHDHHQEEEYGERLEWRLLKHIGGRSLFLGNNHSMCIRASDYPGCKPSSIYFTDDYIEMYHCMRWNGPHDLGVFNMVDGTIENHYPTDHNTPIWPVPIWIQPMVLANADLDPTYCASVSQREGLAATPISKC